MNDEDDVKGAAMTAVWPPPQPLTRDEVECIAFGAPMTERVIDRVLATIDALAAAESARDKFADDLYAEQAEHTAAVTRAETAERERDEARAEHSTWRDHFDGRHGADMSHPLCHHCLSARMLAERDALTQALAARDEAIVELSRELDEATTLATGMAGQVKALTAFVETVKDWLYRSQPTDTLPLHDALRALATKPPTADAKEEP